jgi:CheY-like chemotaxis protein
LVTWLTEHWEGLAGAAGTLAALWVKEWWQTRRETRLTTLKLNETTIDQETRVREKTLDVGLAHEQLEAQQVQALFNEIAKLHALLSDQTANYQAQFQGLTELHKKCEGELVAARDLISSGNERIMRLESLEAIHAEQQRIYAERLAALEAEARVREERVSKLETSNKHLVGVNSEIADVLARYRDEKQASVGIPKSAIPGGGDYPAIRGKRILVVENEDQVIDFFKRALEFHGARVTCTPTYSEAVAEFMRRAPDLVVTDIQLRSRRGGRELLAWIREEDARPCPVVAVTGYTEDLRALVREGFDAVLPKPVDYEPLMATIDSVLERHKDEHGPSPHGS